VNVVVMGPRLEKVYQPAATEAFIPVMVAVQGGAKNGVKGFFPS
jgi:hypothetical protein